jgi:hypothetical protein
MDSFAQIASSFGLLRDVDWASLFKSFYEKVRVKIACMNPSKIPRERLFEMAKKLYMINITVEGYDLESSAAGGESDNDSDGNDGEDNDDDFDDLEEETKDMETNKSLGKTTKTPETKQLDRTTCGAKTVNGARALKTEDLQSHDVIAKLFADLGAEKDDQERDGGSQGEEGGIQGMEVTHVESEHESEQMDTQGMLEGDEGSVEATDQDKAADQ